MKKRVSLTVGLAMAVIAIMYFISQRNVGRPNGFERGRISSTEASFLLSKNNNVHIAYPCGITHDHFYFQSDIPTMLYASDARLSKLNKIRIVANLNPLYPRPRPFVCDVDSPAITIFAGNEPVIVRTGLNDTSTMIIRPNAKFSRAVCLSGNLYLRAFDSSIKSQELCMMRNGHLIYSPNQTAVKNDGGLLGDGLLIADRANKHLIYIHFYNNHINVYDTALRVLRQFHSIDTFSTSQLSTVNFKNGYTTNKPKFIVQKWASANNGLLYVCSLIKADDQSEDDFARNTTIDIYDYISGKYVRSIYLPNKNGHKLSTFTVYGRKLVAVYQDAIALYLLG